MNNADFASQQTDAAASATGAAPGGPGEPQIPGEPRFEGTSAPGARLDDEALIRELISRWLITDAQAHIIRAHAKRRNIPLATAAIELNLVDADVVEKIRDASVAMPLIERPNTAISKEVVVAHDAPTEVTDQFLEIATQVQLRWLALGGPEHTMVSVVSPRRRDGRSFVAANLAITFSRMGLRTLLIDADLRHGRLHELFSLDEDLGLSTLLAGSTRALPLVALADYRNLAVLGRGPLVQRPGDLFGSGVLNRLLRSCSENFDVVLVDTPSAAEAPEARLVAAQTKACVLVARRDKTMVQELRQLAGDLGSIGTTIIGQVMMRI